MSIINRLNRQSFSLLPDLKRNSIDAIEMKSNFISGCFSGDV